VALPRWCGVAWCGVPWRLYRRARAARRVESSVCVVLLPAACCLLPAACCLLPAAAAADRVVRCRLLLLLLLRLSRWRVPQDVRVAAAAARLGGVP
jgi:hypothetical protein